MNNQTNVNSTLIKSVGYNALAEQLSIVLKSNPGTTYVYKDVPRSVANQLIESPSKGRFFNRNVRSRFPTTKIAN